MNIEIANRLQKLRKEKGYSQEELADALGISRQAVSKWERAEASPDTDNLICLAKLYNVSLDDLLSSDEPIEKIVEEQKERTEEEEKNAEDNKKTEEAYANRDENGFTVKDGKDFIHIGPDGVHVVDDDGSEIHIGSKGIKACKSDGSSCSCELHKFKLSSYLEGSLMLLATAGFLLIGFLTGYWASAWILFFLPEIICSIVRCVEKKTPQEFNMPFLACYVFFLVSMVHPGGLWHPMWIVFLAIPVYYSIVSPFRPKKIEATFNNEDND